MADDRASSPEERPGRRPGERVPLGRARAPAWASRRPRASSGPAASRGLRPASAPRAPDACFLRRRGKLKCSLGATGEVPHPFQATAVGRRVWRGLRAFSPGENLGADVESSKELVLFCGRGRVCERPRSVWKAVSTPGPRSSHGWKMRPGALLPSSDAAAAAQREAAGKRRRREGPAGARRREAGLRAVQLNLEAQNENEKGTFWALHVFPSS